MYKNFYVNFSSLLLVIVVPFYGNENSVRFLEDADITDCSLSSKWTGLIPPIQLSLVKMKIAK